MNQASPRVARSREKMLRAATELLVESGPRSVTVDAVAEMSGVAKSTLYRHWGSRDELLVDVVRSNRPETEAIVPGTGFASALRALVASAAAAFSDPEWSRIFPAITSLRSSLPELDSFINADVEAKKAALGAVLDLGVAEGALPDSLDVDQVASMLIGPIAFAAITGPIQGSPGQQLAELGEYLCERFIASYLHQ